MTRIFLPSLVLLKAYLVLAQDRTISVVDTQTQYEGRPVAVYNPLPTLIYNCDRLASICFNVAEFLADPINVAAGMGAVPINFHSDTDQAKARRRQSCPEGWRALLGITCPEANQPNVQPGNLPPRIATGPPNAWTIVGPKFSLEIPNALNTGPSGMRYTCEEFPAASWVEGGEVGTGLAPQSHANCAPMANSCEGFAWKSVKKSGYPSVNSEQNWQGRSHNHIGAYARLRSGLNNPVMRFQFTTTHLGAASTIAAQVVLPAFGNTTSDTKVVPRNLTVKRGDEASDSGVRVSCEGQFCHKLAKHGFEFLDIMDSRPAPPSPSGAPVPAGVARLRVGGEQPEETAPAAATLNILVD